MNRPRDVLTAALLDDLRPHVEALRDRGWPAEIVLEAEPYHVRVVIPLDGVPVPVPKEAFCWCCNDRGPVGEVCPRCNDPVRCHNVRDRGVRFGQAPE